MTQKLGANSGIPNISIFKVGDLVVFKDEYLVYGRVEVKISSSDKVVFEVLTEANKFSVIAIGNSEIFGKTYRYQQHKLQLFCDLVSKVSDIGISKPCGSCPKQLSCLAHIVKSRGFKLNGDLVD